MQIALTKKLSDAMGLKILPVADDENPLVSWTANWIKVWDNRKANDLLVLVNNATRFCLAIYQFQKKDLKNISELINAAISNTLLAIGYNPEMVNEYMRMAGDIKFTQNKNRKAASWVTQAGQYTANHIGHQYNTVPKMFSDTIGMSVNYFIVNRSDDRKTVFTPHEKMREELCALTGMPTYKYRAFELLVTLDLERYKAVRRIIVPTDIEFENLHYVLQRVFDWKNYHLYDFDIYATANSRKKIASLVSFEDELAYDKEAILAKGHRLSEYLPMCKRIVYTYDLGDDWQHEIELVRVIEDYDMESPYLLEASGKTPPEDVGGVPGYLDFLDIINDPKHPEHNHMKAWAGYWTMELSAWEKKPRVIRIRDY